MNVDLYGDACLAPGAAAASVGNGMLEEPVPNNVLLHFFHVFVKTLPRNVLAHVPSCMNTPALAELGLENIIITHVWKSCIIARKRHHL